MGKHVAGANGTLPDGIAFERMTPEQVRAVAFFEGFEMPAEGVQPTGVDGACWLVWAADGHPRHAPGTILNVYVAEAYRRRGIATAMLAEARRIEPRVHHSEILTSDGRAWSEHVAGANGSLPEGLVIRRGDFALGDADPDCVRAFVDGEFVGALHWRVDYEGQGHVVSWISIYDDRWKRRGIATAMWEAAKQIVPDLHHAQNRTDEGQAWSQTTSGLNGGLPASLRLEVKPNRQGITAWMPGADVREVAEGPYGVPPEVLVGELNWGTDGMVTWIAVPYEELRRRGIASAMWDLAKTVEPRLRHSADRSDSGDAWARSTGDPLPEQAWPGTARRTAMPSWRDRGEIPDADIVIKPDTGRSSRNYFEVILHGVTEARFTRLDQAKAFVEQIFGPLQWQRVPGDRTPRTDPVWGPTTEFNDAGYYLVVERAPRLAPSVAHTAQRLYHAAPKAARSSIERHGLDWRLSPAASAPRDPRNLAPVATYFYVDIDEARDMLADGMADTHDLYAVDGDGLTLVPDPYQPESAVYTLDVVPPERLHRMAVRTAAKGDGVDTCKFCGSANLWGNHFDAQGEGGSGEWDLLCQDCGKFQIRRNRRQAAVGQNDSNYIARGFVLTVENRSLFERFANGTVTVQDIIDAAHKDVGRVGRWWGIVGEFDSIEGFRSSWGQVFSEDDYVRYQHEHNEPGYTYWTGQVGVVLVAKRPTFQGKPWHPDDVDDDARGYPIHPAMGNSGLPASIDVVELVEVHYDAGWGWKVLPAQGMRVKASLAKEAWGDYQRRVYESMPVIREVARRFATLDEATALVRRILTDAGFPDAEEAYADRHPSGWGKSSVAWDMELARAGIIRPIVALAVDMQDELTVIHECAHILANGVSARGRNSAAGDPEQGHNPQWMQVFYDLIQRYASTDVRRRFNVLFGMQGLREEWRTAAVRGFPWGTRTDYAWLPPDTGVEIQPWGGREIRIWHTNEWRTLMIANIKWDEDGEVSLIEVRPEWRRRGLATRLWELAQAIEPRLHHSPTRTDEGDAWARAVTPGVSPREWDYDWDTRTRERVAALAAIDPARQGRCYPLAYEHLMANDDGTNRLVHGTLSGGRSHAWVEWTTSPKVVYDPVLDEEFERDFYYREAGARADAVYTADEAERKFAEEGHYGPWDGSVPRVGSKIAALQWVKGTDKYDRPVYRAETEVGTYEVNGNGAGRMRWTVIYPAQYEGGDPDYGMTTSMAEAKAWAEGDYADRMRRRQMLGAKEAEADTEGVMIALVPPDEVNVGLCDLPETTEPLDNQHITVVYLGDTKDVDREALHQAVKAWASGSHPVDGKLSGFGTFDNGDEHVLYAAWQIEDGPGWRDSLKKALQAAGVDREDTYPMWTPHQTLAYTDEPVTALPEMPDVPREVVFGSVVVAYGGDWTAYPLGR